MTNVVFNEETLPTPSQTVSRDPFFVRLLKRYGVAKTRRGAEFVLIGVLLAACVIAVLVFPKGRPAPGENIPVAGPSQGQGR